MKILVISDIHQRIPKIKKILEHAEAKVDKIIFLGDYFDNFDDAPDTIGINETCEFYVETYDRLGDKAIWLCGNHDLPYYEECYRVGYPHSSAHPSKLYCCSGYSANKAKKIAKHFGRGKCTFFKNLQLSVTMEGFTFAHGGFSDFHFKPKLSLTENIDRWKDVFEDAKTSFAQPFASEIYYVGQCRGGRWGVGGPLWLDFKREFVPIDDLPQIVGHTPHVRPARIGNSACFDCWNDYYGIVENGFLDFYVTETGELYDESAHSDE